jgi:hypothetical protein
MKRRPPAPAEQPTAFDRIGWQICQHENKTKCLCQQKRSRCCVALEGVVTSILVIIRDEGRP